MDDAPKSESTQPTRVRLLSTRERWGATSAGVLLAGGGVCAVFLTGNQAGSTALVLMGAVFMLMGIQGTPVTRASKDSVELASRPEEIALKAKKIAEEGDPKDGQAFLEGAVSADPNLRSSPAIRNATGELYEMQVRHALELITWDKQLRAYRADTYFDDPIDFSIREVPRRGVLGSGTLVDVIVKFSKSNSPLSTMRLKNFALADRALPLLIISNTGFSDALLKVFESLRESGNRIQWTQWTNVEDNDELGACIDRIVDASKGD